VIEPKRNRRLFCLPGRCCIGKERVDIWLQKVSLLRNRVIVQWGWCIY